MCCKRNSVTDTLAVARVKLIPVLRLPLSRICEPMSSSQNIYQALEELPVALAFVGDFSIAAIAHILLLLLTPIIGCGYNSEIRCRR